MELRQNDTAIRNIFVFIVVNHPISITGTFKFFDNRGYIRNKNGEVSFLKSVLVGGCGGILGQLGSSPLFLIKTHLQAEASIAIAVGHQHHHKGTIKALKTIYSTHGVR